MRTNVVLAVYDPPASGLLYLAAVIVDNTFVGALATATEAEAQTLIDLVGNELNKITPAH